MGEMTFPRADLRNRLAALLALAAEAEHCLVCRYLFAAFSLKKTAAEGVTWMQVELIRNWAATLLMIARQEMEHLGLVNNLLTAIGEAPHFPRPDFPVASGTLPARVKYVLEKFGERFLLDSILFELPEQLSDDDRRYLEELVCDLEDRYEHNSLQELYEEIGRLMKVFQERELFIGPPGAQFATKDILPVPLVGVPAPRSIYDVTMNAVTDQESALQVIGQIIAEGEGGATTAQTCHFARLLAILKDFRSERDKDPQFEPARNVVLNPKTDGDEPVENNGRPGHVNVITYRPAREVSRLFDLVYETMVLLLARFWSATDESQAELMCLERTIFFR